MCCKYCGQNDHSRITSKKCLLYEKYRCLDDKGRLKMREKSRTMYDATDKRRASRNKYAQSDKRRASRNKYAQTEKRRVSRNKHEETEKRRVSRHNHAQTEKRRISSGNYGKKNNCRHSAKARSNEAHISNAYHANRHLFTKYAAASFASKAAGHVNITKDQLLNPKSNNALKPLTDEEIVNLKERWDAHMKAGANRDVCATCGIIGLSKKTEFNLLEDHCMQAFKVVGF